MICIERQALITQLPHQNELGKYRIFSVISVPDTVLISFGRILLMFNCSFKFSVARPEYGDAYLCTICRIHGQLPTKAACGFTRIFRQL